MSYKLFSIAGGVIAVYFLGFGGGAQTGRKDCDHPDPSRSIPGCTLVIDDKGASQDIRARALLKRGIGYFASRQFDRAIADFDAARRINPNDVIAYNELGLSHQMKGDMVRALEAFDAGLQLFPKSAELHYNRGEVHEFLGDLDKAIADYETAIGLSPGERTGFLDTGKVEMIAEAKLKSGHYGRLANAYFAKGDFDRALATYDVAISIYPEYSRIYSERSKVFAAQGDLARTRADLDLAIKLEPQRAPNYARRAMVAFQTNDFKQAAADYEKAWAIDPRGTGLPKDYIPLWQFITRARSDVKAADMGLRERLPSMNQAAWPFPVAQMLLGQQPFVQTLDAAKTADERCEAQFYGGEWHLLHGNTAAARAAITIAYESCPKQFIEFKGAEAEVKRLAQ